MKETHISINALTGEETITEVEISEEELALRAIQQRKFEIQERMNAIVQELKETDFVALKAFEGAMTLEEFEPIKQLRIDLRLEYNTLEQELGE